jgi:transcriptional regulator of acetoin/glycerol metabolism
LRPAVLFLHPIPHGKLFKATAGYNRITLVSQGFEINVIRRTDHVAHVAALVEALRASHGNQSLAAAILGVSRIIVWRWIKKYNLDLDAVLKS